MFYRSATESTLSKMQLSFICKYTVSIVHVSNIFFTRKSWVSTITTKGVNNTNAYNNCAYNVSVPCY